MDYKVPIQLYDEDKWDWVILESIKNCLKDFKLYLEGFYLIKMNE